MGNYNEKYMQLAAELAETIRKRKTCDLIRFAYEGIGYDVINREERITLIQRITHDYMTAHAEYTQCAIDNWLEKGCNGERPITVSVNTTLLERLADAILDEELTDPDPHKVAHTEYPFFSDWQLDLRRDRESSFKVTEETGTDGRDYRVPKRRKRTNHENAFIDRTAKSRNKARAAQYKRDTSPGEVVPYNLRENGGELTEPFVDCRRIGARWRDTLSLVY